MGHIDNLSVSTQVPLLAFSRFFLMELKNMTLSAPTDLKLEIPTKL